MSASLVETVFGSTEKSVGVNPVFASEPRLAVKTKAGLE